MVVDLFLVPNSLETSTAPTGNKLVNVLVVPLLAHLGKVSQIGAFPWGRTTRWRWATGSSGGVLVPDLATFTFCRLCNLIDIFDACQNNNYLLHNSYSSPSPFPFPFNQSHCNCNVIVPSPELRDRTLAPAAYS